MLIMESVLSMKEQLPQVRVFGLDQFNYPKFRGKIIDLYLNAFTKGEFAQYIPEATAESTLDDLLRNGFGNMAFVGDRLAGILIALPLSYDKDFPNEQCSNIPLDKTVYIAEVMVHTDFRERGVASHLLETFLQHANEVYTHTVIRVWDENEPALNLYRKLGFVEVASLFQTKFRSEDEGFEMRKIYMAKEIRS